MTGAPKLKDRWQNHTVIVGLHPDEKLVQACQIEGCPEAATQYNGPPDFLIYTCDAHTEAVMLWFLEQLQ